MALAQLVDQMFELTGYQKSNLHFILGKLSECLVKSLEKDGSVQINGLGTFSIAIRKAKKGRNPRTGESLDIPEKKVVHFKMHRSFRDSFQK